MKKIIVEDMQKSNVFFINVSCEVLSLRNMHWLRETKELDSHDRE